MITVGDYWVSRRWTGLSIRFILYFRTLNSNLCLFITQTVKPSSYKVKFGDKMTEVLAPIIEQLVVNKLKVRSATTQ